MPGFDRTGPRGGGPMTGGGRGYCMSSNWVGRPRMGWGGGFGRGWRHRFWETEVSGRSWWSAPFGYGSFTPEEELKELKQEATYLEKELSMVRRQIEKMANDQSERGSEE